MITYPLALLALASLPALAAIYFLRNRFRRRQVSSLMLWRFRVQSKEGGARVQKLQLPLIFFLELLALLMLVTAAAGPHWKLAKATRPLIVVLDDSFSMRAKSDGATSADRARAALLRLYRFQAPPSTRVILAGAQPQLLGGSARTAAEVEALLAGWRCLAPHAALDSAVTLAGEVGRGEANILVLSDHAPADEKIVNPRLQWRSFGRPINNVAIVNASRTAHGDEDRCLLEVANFSSQPHSSRISVQSSSNAVQQTVLELGAGEQQRFVFNLPKSGEVLQVRLPADSVELDDLVELVPPQRKRVRVRVALTNEPLNELVERTLEATGLRAALVQNPELVIHHSDHSPGSNTWSVRWNIPADAKAFTGPFVIDSAHPLSEGVALAGVVWAAGAITNAADEVPVVMAGNVPLLSAREDLSGRRFLTLNFQPELSTLQRSPDWPVLWWNLLDWRIRQMPGLVENNVRLGSDVVVRTSADAVLVRSPDGSEKTYPHFQQQLAVDAPIPGVYSVVFGSSTNLFAVNTLAPEESNLQKAAEGEWGAWNEDVTRRQEQSPLAWIFALCALAVLSVHLCMLALGKGAA
ncbi:MAG TPA: VWA domain-containing protein [Verrucomicrobiae bacterium]|nr:VWA domain-containing protein [Verrucomicrobiae bacterium]